MYSVLLPWTAAKVLTPHGLMDYGLDKQTGKYEAADRKKDLMDEYLKWFCEENAVERNREDTE